MFSGIVETIGVIQQLTYVGDCLQATIFPKIAWDDLKIGDSVSVNGVCLTVTQFTTKGFSTTMVPQTLRLTNLQRLKVGDAVNLERALKASDRIGGHYVQGHVDGVGEIIDIRAEGDAQLVKMRIPEQLTKYLVDKGYVALDGMSITLINVQRDTFTVTFIPHTQQATIISHYQLGTKINIEVDILSKFVEKLLRSTVHE